MGPQYARSEKKLWAVKFSRSAATESHKLATLGCVLASRRKPLPQLVLMPLKLWPWRGHAAHDAVERHVTHVSHAPGQTNSPMGY